jgi:RNA polymerase sigma factor (sigma-70 family)
MYSSETASGHGPVRATLRLPAWALGEQRLARMAARGERGAFEALFTRYHRELYHYCRAIVGEPDEAHDALQNTMAVALGHLPNVERRKSLRGWLYRVAHNEAVSILRRRPAPVDPLDLPEGAGPGADTRFEERERLRQLVIDLRALPTRQRGALVIRELSGLSYSQIAAAMEASEAGARQLVYEARESLRALELGRELDCASARRVISERDGRVLRGRRLRAHLRECASCHDFKAAIGRRRTDLAALFPPLAPAAASSLLASLLGAGQGGASAGVSGAAMGGGGGAALGGVGVKAASMLSVVALGAGVAGISGGIKPPAIHDDQDIARAAPPPTRSAPGPASATPPDAPGRSANSHAGSSAEDAGSSAGRAGAPSHVTHPPSRPPVPSRGNPPAHAQSGGPPATPPGSSNSGRPPQAGSPSSGEHPAPPADQGLAQATTVRASPGGSSAATAATPRQNSEIAPDNLASHPSTQPIPQTSQ